MSIFVVRLKKMRINYSWEKSIQRRTSISVAYCMFVVSLFCKSLKESPRKREQFKNWELNLTEKSKLPRVFKKQWKVLQTEIQRNIVTVKEHQLQKLWQYISRFSQLQKNITINFIHLPIKCYLKLLTVYNKRKKEPFWYRLKYC